MKRLRRKDFFEELDAILFEDLPYWYRNKFDYQLMMRRLHNFFDNYEPTLFIWGAFVMYYIAGSFSMGLLDILDGLQLRENFYSRIIVNFCLFLYFSVIMYGYIIEFYSSIYEARELEKEKKKKKNEGK